MAPFPDKNYPDDVHGQGSPQELAKIIAQTRQRFVEVLIKKSDRYNFSPGTHGQYQYTLPDEETINIAVTYIENGSPNGLDTRQNCARTNLGPDCEIQWVIHPVET